MTQQSILDQLDYAAGEFEFPMMNNGYVYPADVRMSIYRDQTRWLMIIESLGAYSPRTSGCDSFQNCLHIFGNSLNRKCGTWNEDFLYPIDSSPDEPLFQDQYDWYVRPGVSSLRIRGQRMTLDVSHRALQERGIVLIEPPKIDPPALLRSLLPEHRYLLLASDQELEARNEYRLPLWMRLDEWFHPDLARNELPSKCETFQMLSNAIASGNKDVYRPTHEPNTHWQNWLDGGTL